MKGEVQTLFLDLSLQRSFLGVFDIFAITDGKRGGYLAEVFQHEASA